MYQNHTGMNSATRESLVANQQNHQNQQPTLRHSLPRKRDGEITNQSRSCTRLDLRSGLACPACRALAGWDCGQMTRSAAGGCMYLTLPPVQHHHKRYSTVYIHRHAWGCCAASGTHDAVPGTELPILYTNAAVEGGSSDLARP